MIGLGKYVAISGVAAGAVVYHAFATREQFYPAMQYLTSSKLSIAVMGNLAFALALVTYRMVTKIFLGNLREAEVERINERISQAVMETCLAMTIFREEFNASFVAMFVTLTFVKVFHWLVQDRVDFIETTPSTSMIQHAKIFTFMGLLLTLDSLFLQYTISQTIKTGPSVLLLFAFEYVIQASVVVSTSLKYAFIGIDTLLDGRWESKGVYVFYLELITDMLHLFVYLLFFIIVFTYYGLPLHLVRDLYWTFRNFRQRVSDFLRYRRVTANMNERFPDATPEDLARCDGTCIICREEMTAAGVNKRLPCGHVFHLPCLRSWLERQQNCPTCRATVMQQQSSPSPAAAPAQQEAGQAVAQGAPRPPAPGGQPPARQQPAQLPARPAPGAQAAPRPPPAPTSPAGQEAQPQLAAAAAASAAAAGAGAEQDAARLPQTGIRRRHVPSGTAAQPQAGTGQAAAAQPMPQTEPAGTAQQQAAPFAYYQQMYQAAAQWGGGAPMMMFPGVGMPPQQYAGQQAPMPPASGGSRQQQAAANQQALFANLSQFNVPMVPLPLMMPSPAVAVPAHGSGATPEQHQAAMAAAAAATAAVYSPWSSMLMMPPTMSSFVPGSTTQGGGASEGRVNSAAVATASATAAAAACAAAAAAIVSTTSQAPSTAAKVLRTHIDSLQSQMRELEASLADQHLQSEQNSSEPASVKGKEKVEESPEPEACDSSAPGLPSTSSQQVQDSAVSTHSLAADLAEDKTQQQGSASATSEHTLQSGEDDAERVRKQRLARLGN